MKSLFRFSLIFFKENFGLLCTSLFIKVNALISSLEETSNGRLIFGFVIDSFHIDWRSCINNTQGVTSLHSLWFWRLRRKGFLECWKIINLCPWVKVIVKDYCDSWFLRAIFSVGFRELVSKIPKEEITLFGLGLLYQLYQLSVLKTLQP